MTFNFFVLQCYFSLKTNIFFPNNISSGIFIFPVPPWFPEYDLHLFLSFDDYGHEET